MLTFLMGTTSSITLQRLVKIAQCALAVGAKMWCLFVFRLDALALSVIATATWLGSWLGGWVAGCLSQPVLYQND